MKKLDNKQLGPFEILEKIGTHAYKLELPESMKCLHPVFHVSLLEPYIENKLDDRYEPAPHPVEIVNDNQYEVEQVIDVCLKDNKLQYLLHWKGFGIADQSWEDFDNINCR